MTGPEQAAVVSKDTGVDFGDSAFARATGPILAIVTVLLTFTMFAYFVFLINRPLRESGQLYRAQQTMVAAETKFSQISSSRAERAVEGRLAEARRERDTSRTRFSLIKDLLEAEKEKRAMVKDIVMYILGVLSSALMTILGYYFGSSKSSADKNAVINALAAKSQPQTAPAPVSAPAAADNAALAAQAKG